jgi:hypothetical protein
MSVLSGKKILLESPVELPPIKQRPSMTFIKAGAHVQVIMTAVSNDFITRFTLSTLSKTRYIQVFMIKIITRRGTIM